MLNEIIKNLCFIFLLLVVSPFSIKGKQVDSDKPKKKKDGKPLGMSHRSHLQERNPNEHLRIQNLLLPQK